MILSFPFVLRAAPLPSALVLLCEANSTRAIAFEAFTFKKEPFSPFNALQFSPDSSARIVIFAKNLFLLAGEDVTALTADADQTLIYSTPSNILADAQGAGLYQ